MKALVRELYGADSARAVAFRYALLAFDVVTVLFLIGSSFTDHTPLVEAVDVVIGIGIVADFAARLWISERRLRDLVHPYGLVDIVVMVSLLAPMIGEGFAFLRVARMLRLLRSYQTVRRLRTDFEFFRRKPADDRRGDQPPRLHLRDDGGGLRDPSTGPTRRSPTMPTRSISP